MAKDKIKYKQVKVNLTHEKYKILEDSSNQLEITKAEFIRRCIGATFENSRQPRSRKVVSVIDPKLLYQLNKIGNNLNQIARYANVKKELDTDVLISLSSIEKMLMRLL